ncbi:MAG: riboflavin synthase [Flammeovirgaceae bacterium]|nr:riboflavin synthase [Flammeovirgaceae bacterium]|tara:strand:+ start:227 stop:808 length:582 start_codon:yes stop_codon:yes gene_type:complete
MFTGIVETTGVIDSLNYDKENLNLTVSSSISHDLRVDESLSHDGVCLTVTRLSDKSHDITLVPETLKKSRFSDLEVGSLVNLERSLKVSDRLDGHIVQGHVDDIARCKKIIDNGNNWVYTFKSKNFLKYVVEKGSITVNGVSLTCFDIRDNFFSVAIIPHTYSKTNFKLLSENDLVNIEYDILGKYIERLSKH